MEPWEAVQVLDGGWPIQRARDAKGEKRYYAEGYTEEGRYLRVIFAVESVSPVTARIVTAYPAR